MASKRGCAKEAWRGRELASSHERTCEVSEESVLGAVGTALIYHIDIERRQSTGLIIEDDTNWDVNIKSQLVEFARAVHT
jgi:hypothetical protein